MGTLALILVVGYLLKWTVQQPMNMAAMLVGYGLTSFLIFGVLQLQNWPQPLGYVTGFALSLLGPITTDRAYKLFTGKKGG